MDERHLDAEISAKINLLVLEHDETEYMIQNGNKDDLREQSQFYEKQLKEIRELSRKAKEVKIKSGTQIIDIKKWDDEVRELKRPEELLYQELRKVLEEIVQDEKKETEQFELEKLRLASQHTNLPSRNENAV